MSPILPPLFLQVALTFVILFALGFLRVSQAVGNEEVKRAVRAGRKDAYSRPALLMADNFSNLSEMPILFYAGVLTALVTDTVTGALVSLAWAFAILRVVHSAVHVTVNIVPIRFAFFLLSNIALLIFWILLASYVL